MLNAKNKLPHFRHKLNMFYPGFVMVCLLTVTAGIGMLLWFWDVMFYAKIAFFVSGGILFVLILLVSIELWQDRILNEAAIRENEHLEKEAEAYPWKKRQ